MESRESTSDSADAGERYRLSGPDIMSYFDANFIFTEFPRMFFAVLLFEKRARMMESPLHKSLLVPCNVQCGNEVCSILRPRQHFINWTFHAFN